MTDKHVETLKAMAREDREESAAMMDEIAARYAASGDARHADEYRREAARIRAKRFAWESDAA